MCKTGKRFFSILTAMALIITVSVTPMPAYAAANASGYSSAKALEYAAAHCNDGGDDCVVFARACVEAGGIPKDKDRNYGYTPEQYKDYLVDNGFAVINELTCDYYYSDYQGIRLADNEGKVAPGDIILYHCNNKDCTKQDFHMSIVKGADGDYKGKYVGWITCYAHNVAQDNKVVCKVRHKKCGAEKNTITLYAIHFKSTENGYTYEEPEKVEVSAPVLKASKSGTTSIKLSWSKVAGADGYRIYRSTSKTGTYKAIKTITNGSTTVYTNKKLSKGKRYYYKVKAYVSNDGKKTYSSYSGYKSVKL